jgi:hypothetical protein
MTNQHRGRTFNLDYAPQATQWPDGRRKHLKVGDQFAFARILLMRHFR